MTSGVVIHNRFAERQRPERTAVVLVDCQSAVAGRCCADPDALRDNLLGLLRVARAFGMPVVVGTLRNTGYGRLLPGLARETRGVRAVERLSGGFWDDESSITAVRGCARRELLIAGIDPEFGLAGLSLGARDAGFAVRAIADASAGGSPSDQRIGASRLSAAGVELTSWVAVMAEFSSATTGCKPAPADSAALTDSLARYHAGAIRWGEARASGAL
jgi:hypothetical protein